MNIPNNIVKPPEFQIIQLEPLRWEQWAEDKDAENNTHILLLQQWNQVTIRVPLTGHV